MRRPGPGRPRSLGGLRGGRRQPSLGRLKWLAIVVPIAGIAVVQAVGMLAVMPGLGRLWGHLWSITAVSAGVVIFSTVVFRAIGRMQKTIMRQNEELSALNAVSAAVAGSLELEEAVTRALSNVTVVTGASAAQIVVEGAMPGEPPLSVFQGDEPDRRRLERLCEADHPHAHEASADGVRFVDIGGVSNGAAAASGGQSPTTLACVPLRVRERGFGIMRLLVAGENLPAPEGRERLLAAIGNQIATAVRCSHLFNDIQRKAKELQALHDIGLDIASLQDIQAILQRIVEHAREALGSEAAALCLVRKQGNGMALASRSGPASAFLRSPVQVPPFPVTLTEAPRRERTGATRCPALSDDYRACHLSAHLKVGNSTIGEICFANRRPGRVTERHRQLLAGLADMAAIAINNARLLESERQVAVLEERQRLAREMHDCLAQAVGYLHLKTQVACRSLARGDTVAATQQLEEIASVAHEAYRDVRHSILDLRETISPTLGIVGTLSDFVQKFGRQTGIAAQLELRSGEKPSLSPEVEVQLLRVIQEAMTNVRKHAQADKVLIRISPEPDSVRISVEDNGRGFDPAQVYRSDGGRLGIQVMQERVERLGGRFELKSSPGMGTQVRVEFFQENGGDDEPY